MGTPLLLLARSRLQSNINVLTLSVQIVILTLTIPLFLRVRFTGLVDALVRQDLRKFRSERESDIVGKEPNKIAVAAVVDEIDRCTGSGAQPSHKLRAPVTVRAMEVMSVATTGSNILMFLIRRRTAKG